MDDKQFKREQRFLLVLDELLETTSQLEHDLNYFADYVQNHKLCQARKHVEAVYTILKQVEGDLI